MSESDATSKTTTDSSSSQSETEVTQSFSCRECGGRLRITEDGHTDASAWEQHECVDCGGEGEFYISEGTKRDGGRKRGVTKRDYDLQP